MVFKKDHQYQKAEGKKFEQQDGKKSEQQEGKKGNGGEPPKYNKYGGGGSPSNRYRNDRGYRSPCGKQGHKVADCKEKKDAQVKLGRLIRPNEFPPMKFEGKIGKYKAQMLLDSGADSSVVPPRLVEESEYMGKLWKRKDWVEVYEYP